MFGLKAGISGGIKEAEKIVNEIAAGDLSHPIDERTAPDLLRSIHSMQMKLAGLYHEIYTNSKSLSVASEELGGLSGSMRKAAVHMFKRAAEVNAKTENMGENLNSVSAAAEELNANMAEVAERARDSAENINAITTATEDMTATIAEIAHNSETARTIAEKAATSVANASEKVSNLGQAAAEINKVISVITEISEQTKLLALNATIEAARAGEAGKGFAVVANEVKELAKQTSNATGDISSKVVAIQTATKQTVDEINNIRTVISEVNNIVSSIAAAVDKQSMTSKDISNNINMVAVRITDMTSSIQEASTAVEDVTKNITQSAGIAKEVITAISEVAQKSDEIQTDTAKVYASGMEVASLGSDIEKICSRLKFPGEFAKTGKVQRHLVSYSEIYSVGIRSLNEQHQKIMAYINEIHQAVKTDQDLGAIRNILKDLAAFTVTHFASEEKYFQQYAYPEYLAHKAQHDALLARVGEIIEAIENKREVNLIEVLVFIKDWLQNHILGVDKKYGPYLVEKGVI